MPFVRNVHLVVSGKTQVPEWASDRLKVVTHRDIIPEEFLPTFNSTTIEMFLHRIPGLDERFIYFNDDMFPVSPCREEDFFRDGKIVIGVLDPSFSDRDVQASVPEFGPFGEKGSRAWTHSVFHTSPAYLLTYVPERLRGGLR